MKRICFILILTSIHSFCLAQDAINVEVSAFKFTFIKVPSKFHIIKPEPGELTFIDVQVLSNNLLKLKAKHNQIMDTNLIVFCEEGMLFANLIVLHSTTNIFNEFSEDHLLPLEISNTSMLSTSATTATAVAVPVVVAETQPIVKATSGTLIMDDISYFDKQRVYDVGTQKQGVRLEVTNISIEGDSILGDFIGISFKIENTTNVVFHTDQVQWFITSTGKINIATLGDNEMPIPYKEISQFPKQVEGKESQLFIMKFKKFSLTKKTSLVLIVGEGKGLRTLSCSITNGQFYKKIVPVQDAL